MKVPANQIKKGDYIQGFGTVNDIRVFYADKAVHTKTGPMNRKFIPLPDHSSYARLVAEQQETSYSHEDGTVVVLTVGCSRSFHANDMVDVYRVSCREAC